MRVRIFRGILIISRFPERCPPARAHVILPPHHVRPGLSSQGEGEQPALCSVLQEWHTRIVRDSCSPLYGEQFSCALLRQQDLPRVTLRMEVGARPRPPSWEAAGRGLTQTGAMSLFYGSLNTSIHPGNFSLSINGLVHFCWSYNSSR